MIRGIIGSVVQGVIQRFSAAGRPGETIEDRELFQQYGYTSRPLTGAEVIIINEGNHFIAIATEDRRYRLNLQNGEVALYTDEGDKIHLKRNREIEVVGGEKVTVTTKIAEITATTSAKVTSPTVTVVASDEIILDTPQVSLTGHLTVYGEILTTDGSVSSQKGWVFDNLRSMQQDRDIYNGHKHNYVDCYGVVGQLSDTKTSLEPNEQE